MSRTVERVVKLGDSAYPVIARASDVVGITTRLDDNRRVHVVAMLYGGRDVDICWFNDADINIAINKANDRVADYSLYVFGGIA